MADNCPLTDAVGIARPQDGDGDGTPACDAGPLEQQNGPDIGQGQSGAFFDMNRNGEVTGNSIYITEMLMPEGPAFGPGYDPALLNVITWGRMSVHWPSCTVPQNEPGVMTFQSRDDAYGKVRVFTGRLTALAGAACTP